MSIIEVSNLSKVYQYYRKQPGLRGTLKSFVHRQKLYAEAVKDVSFNIEAGELVGFLGPNGAGKTTTLKMLSGIIHPSSGSVRVLGHEPAKREKVYQKQFALVMGQKNQLINDLPAMESFIINREIYEIPRVQFDRNLAELVEVFDIGTILDIPVRKLSLGQRMKCELAAALLHQPKVLFLDEPTIGLDVVAQKSIRDFIKKYNQLHGTTIILTSHYMEDIQELCQRVVIINLGRIIYDGRLEDLISHYATYKVLKVTLSGDGVTRAMFEAYGDIEEFTSYSCTLRVPREQSKQRASALLQSTLPIEDILIDEVDIDDVIRHIFQG